MSVYKKHIMVLLSETSIFVPDLDIFAIRIFDFKPFLEEVYDSKTANVI